MSRRREDGGQATAELALVLPVVCLLTLAVVQVALVARAQLLVEHAAREGARAAAVDPAPGAAAAAVVAAVPLDPSRLETTVTEAGAGRVRVEVRYRLLTDVPLIGPLLDDVDLRAATTMRREPAP